MGRSRYPALSADGWVWAATEAQFRATLDLQDAQNHVQHFQLQDGQVPSVQGVLLTIHPADRPVPSSLIGPEQCFAVVDVGLDACDITDYQARPWAPAGQRLRLMLADRRSVVRLDCLTNITKGCPSWSVAIHEVDESAAVQDISVQMPIAYLDGAPDGDDVWKRGATSGSMTPGWASSARSETLLRRRRTMRLLLWIMPVPMC